MDYWFVYIDYYVYESVICIYTSWINNEIQLLKRIYKFISRISELLICVYKKVKRSKPSILKQKWQKNPFSGSSEQADFKYSIL